MGKKKGNKSLKKDVGNRKNISSRRDFVKLLSFGAGATALFSACEQPVRKLIPYLIQPEEVIPGKAYHYCTTYFEDGVFCPVVVKVRDGRPIKIEGNNISGLNYGGTSAKIQASILDLYNPDRQNEPLKSNKSISFDALDKEIIDLLEQLRETGKVIYFVTPTIISPATNQLLNEFKVTYPNVEIVSYDPISFDASLKANLECFGIEKIPDYRFIDAKVIVGFNADFLGSWLSPVEFSKQYSKLKEPQVEMCKHFQFETTYTITGGAADKRFPINPSDEVLYLSNLYNSIAELTDNKKIECSKVDFDFEVIAESLVRNSGNGIVLSGSNDFNVQILVNAINSILGNINSTIDFSSPFLTKAGSDESIGDLIQNLNTTQTGGIIFYQVDPFYNIISSNEIKDIISNLALSISINTYTVEEGHHIKYNIPANHYLESWFDAEPKSGLFSLGQPMISPLFNTRQAQDNLLKWMGSEIDFYNYLKNYWEVNIYPQTTSAESFSNFWDSTLQEGLIKIEQPAKQLKIVLNSETINSVILSDSKPEEIEVHLFEPITGVTQSSLPNPWLLELPDPITKICWGNAALVSPQLAKNSKIKDGQIIEISNGEAKIKLPVSILKGQAENTISIALGFGKSSDRLGSVGVNAFSLVKLINGSRHFNFIGKIKPTEEYQEIALGQLYSSNEGRDLIREINLDAYIKRSKLFIDESHHVHVPSFYKKPEYAGYHWGMAIDLNKCTGCSTCVIACQAENNIPVVGKNEVIRKHEMHWMRIDRYFEGEDKNPGIQMQPVMCQHCDYAPCENVCPVAATNHSSEGINQMVYNRCIGTRYCENNCPYKVRRFNWYDYTKADPIRNNEFDVADLTNDLSRMVLNPDVTVRSKGVIEKCSFCFQRIIEAKNNAKLKQRSLYDGEVRPACAQSCPSDAIVFGDMNDRDSKISKLIKDKRSYVLLKELNTLPSVFYLAKVKNNMT